MALQLYSYWRSSAAFRVRIALNLKGLAYESVPKHLLRDGGEQKQPEYLAVNPQGLVPALADDGFVIPQSIAICEYLEEAYPQKPLLPKDPLARAKVRELASGEQPFFQVWLEWVQLAWLRCSRPVNRNRPGLQQVAANCLPIKPCLVTDCLNAQALPLHLLEPLRRADVTTQQVPADG